jgi:hypothetical protein
MNKNKKSLRKNNRKAETVTIAFPTEWVLAKDELTADESDVSIHQEGEPQEEPGEARKAGRRTIGTTDTCNSYDDSHSLSLRDNTYTQTPKLNL